MRNIPHKFRCWDTCSTISGSSGGEVPEPWGGGGLKARCWGWGLRVYILSHLQIIPCFPESLCNAISQFQSCPSQLICRPYRYGCSIWSQKINKPFLLCIPLVMVLYISTRKANDTLATSFPHLFNPNWKGVRVLKYMCVALTQWARDHHSCL